MRFVTFAVLLLGASVAWGADLRVVASFYPLYGMTLNIVGAVPGVNVECMAGKEAGCLHDYQLTPANLRTLGKADILVANGAGLEAFLTKTLRGFPNLRVVEASKGIPLTDGNPHIWVSLRGAIAEVRNIAAELAAVDPTHAADYQRNAADYVARLETLSAEMHAEMDALPHREIVTFHEAFPYFAQEFGLKIVAVVEREPGAEPSAGELAETIQIIRQKNVRALFAEPQYPAKFARVIERETGVPVRVLDPVVTGPLDPEKARTAYETAMRRNLSVLKEALK